MNTEEFNDNQPVNPCSDLSSVTGEIVHAMSDFRHTKSSKLEKAAQWIQRALNLERAHNRWIAEATTLVHEGRALLNSEDAPPPDYARATHLTVAYAYVGDDKKYGGKRRAEACRSAFLRLEESRGSPLTPDPLRGPYYRNGHNLLVGLPFSSDLGNRWWVNFKKECDEIGMLCDSKTNAVRVVRLARPFFEKYRRHFRPGEDGLIQITLRMRDGRIYAQVPDHGQIDVTNYADREPFVCERRDNDQFA